MALEEIAALIIRLTIGLLVVISAYVCSKDAASRQGAIADTALVFPWRTELFTFAGVMLMLLGGLSVLLGIFPRLGAIALTLFLIPAAMIHFRKASQSRRPEGRHPRRAGREVGHRAGIRHCARRFRHARQFQSALKNLTLMALTLYIALAGAEPTSASAPTGSCRACSPGSETPSRSA
jgi:uncharacterized membrane protein YphA (DoxX/SURF4 family)